MLQAPTLIGRGLFSYHSLQHRMCAVGKTKDDPNESSGDACQVCDAHVNQFKVFHAQINCRFRAIVVVRC